MRGLPNKTRRRKSPRQYELTIRLASEEVESVRSLAKEAGHSMAEFVRILLLVKGDHLERVGSSSRPRKTSSATDPTLLYHLARIGNNLNQIARRVNSLEKGKGVPVDFLYQLVSVERDLSSFLPIDGKAPGEKGLREGSANRSLKPVDAD